MGIEIGNLALQIETAKDYFGYYSTIPIFHSSNIPMIFYGEKK